MRARISWWGMASTSQSEWAMACAEAGAPSKNSTWVTLPSESAAVAPTVTVTGATKCALFVGEVMATVGGSSTVIVTGADVMVSPTKSVALAVRVYLPAGTLFQVML